MFWPSEYLEMPIYMRCGTFLIEKGRDKEAAEEAQDINIQ